MSGELVLVVFAVIALGAIAVIGSGLDPSVVVSIGLATSIFSGNWGDLGLPIGIDRIIIVVGIGMAIVAHVRRGDPWPPVRAVHLVLAALAAYAIASAAWVGTATDKGSAFALLDQLGVIPFLLFATAPIVFARHSQRLVLVAVMATTGAYLAFTGVAETIGATPLVFPRYINDPSLGIHFDRARGPFLESAAFGGALFTCAAICVLALVLFKDRRWIRYAIAAVLLATALAIVGTLTRQIWLASVVTLVVTLAGFARLRRYLLPIVLVGAVVTVAALVAVPGLADRAQARADNKRSVWDRTNSNRAAERMIGERPVLGFGWGRFTEVGTDFYVQSPDYPVTTVAELHNVPLSFLAELGVVGFGGWVLALVLAAAGTARRRGPPELSAWQISVVMMTVNWLIVLNFAPFRSSFTNYVVWTWLGVAGVVVQSARRATARSGDDLPPGGSAPSDERAFAPDSEHEVREPVAVA